MKSQFLRDPSPLRPKMWVILSLEACFQQFIITDCVPVNRLTNDTSLPTGLLNFVLKSRQMKWDVKVWFWSPRSVFLLCNLNFSFFYLFLQKKPMQLALHRYFHPENSLWGTYRFTLLYYVVVYASVFLAKRTLDKICSINYFNVLSVS